MASSSTVERVNLDKPRYDQSTYGGRARYFFVTTNPLNVFATSGQLDKAKELVQLYRFVGVILS